MLSAIRTLLSTDLETLLRDAIGLSALVVTILAALFLPGLA